jgi:hypothetical protein
MDIVINSINNRNLEMLEQIAYNDKSKESLLTFKNNVDTVVKEAYRDVAKSKCIDAQIFLLSEALHSIKNECDLISSNVYLYATKAGYDMYIKAVEYGDNIISSIEDEMNALSRHNNHRDCIGNFSFNKHDISLSPHDHNQLNDLMISDEYEMNVLVPQDIMKFYYRQKYGDSKKRKKDVTIYDSDHFKKWYQSAEKKKWKIITPDVENEYDKYKYYEKRFGNKYQRKRDPTMFDSVHFKDWLSKKTVHLKNVDKYVKEKTLD